MPLNVGSGRRIIRALLAGFTAMAAETPLLRGDGAGMDIEAPAETATPGAHDPQAATDADSEFIARAEMVAIHKAGAALERDELNGATLYSTLQPCGMCTMASIWSRIDRVVYGAGRDDAHRMYFEDRHLDTMNFIRDAYRGDMPVVGGVMRDECAALYYGPNDDPPAEEQGNI